MIKELEHTDLLSYSLDGIIHSCNCQHIMGGGIARLIKNKFPEAYEADLKTPLSDRTKLGTFSLAVLPSNFHIYNMYGQFNIGPGRNTSYDAFDIGLRSIEEHAVNSGLSKIGLPARIGCVLGGGSWRIIHAMIYDIFSPSKLDLFICDYP